MADVMQESATRRAYRALERMIVTLELSPGSVTTEGALIERIGLGRTPVREAIQRLAWEGLLEVRARAGLAVTPLHASDWVKIIDARRGVEAVLARAAARHATRETAQRFHDALLAMRKAVVAGNVLAFLQADKALDEAMADASDNPYAAMVAEPLQIHSRRFWYRYQAESGLSAAADRHMTLIKAVLEGDGDEAAAESDRLMALLRSYAEEAAR
ncbi:GntR family transcriptional regulator [Mesorhizobium australicum]|uniref:Transcriptional regulator, GntR family n=1 Tax=Mesorhizobium australicum TaxID=536018 RepID=A0A1X7PZC5_9HYPH|nr:GntR family transcriptional regulator [Mesorhizobium australicum]SMH56841.1 transcriptional regulator, GntR family [Mesorhizobium australicum]